MDEIRTPMRALERRSSPPALSGIAVAAALVASTLAATPALAQEPVAWGPDLEFHTFSIVAIDPRTGESGVAVTTRRPCVGNAVPWVRPGVGALATQGGTCVGTAPSCSNRPA